ncbi:MAG: malate synthase A [Bdellovibrionota bacterium]
MNLFSDATHEFLNKLHLKFDERRKELLLKRKEKIDLNFPRTISVRNEEWQVVPAPKDLIDRRVEITGPAEPKMIINALNSGAQVFMADLEDSLSPTWQKLQEGQIALAKAVRRDLAYENENGKIYSLGVKTATLVVRPRGLHLEEDHYEVAGSSISASLYDFGVYFFNNAKELIKRGSGPYFYLPKLESYHEAAWWSDVFEFSEKTLAIPKSSIRATVLIETLPAAFQMEEILYSLKDYAAGLNAGRWDYIFSMIKKCPEKVLPNRDQVTMSTGFMNSYCELLVQSCHKRGAHAIGGMAAFIPNRKQPEVTEAALLKVKADKAREAGIGFDGSWVAHPDLVATAFAEFEAVLKYKPHQKDRVPTSRVLAEDLVKTQILNATVSEEGVRTNINVALLYIDRWLSGQGAAALYNLMEDAATAEISRSQLWQWLNYSVTLKDGRTFDKNLFKTWLAEEKKSIEENFETAHLNEAETLLAKLVLSTELSDFLTLLAYPSLNLIHTNPYREETL